MIIQNFEQGSRTWLAFRKIHITATDIGTILGLNEKKSPYMLWQEKLDFIAPDTENDAMRRGKALEPIALESFCDQMGLDMKPIVATNSEFPWAMCSIDGYDIDVNRGVEIKCMGPKNHEEAMNGIVKPLYMAQMQWQMFVTGVQDWHYYAYSEENDVIKKVLRNPLMIADMVAKGLEFLNCLRTITPPELTDLDYEDRSNNPSWLCLEQAYEDADYNEKCAKEAKEIIKKRMIELSAGRNVKGAKSRFTQYIMKGQVDYKKIPELIGVDLEPYRKPSSQCYRITLKDSNGY